MAVGNPAGGGDHFKAMYMQSRHEYNDTVTFHKLYGLGWKKIVNDQTAWPRSGP